MDLDIPQPDSRAVFHGGGNRWFGIVHRWRQLLPSWPMIFGLFALMPPRHPEGLLNDPDTYLHIKAGQWMIRNHALPMLDTFSHSMTGERWVPHEWLAELMMALSYRWFGWNGVVLLGTACFAAAMAITTRKLLRHIDPLLVPLVMFSTVLLIQPHLLVRAHILALPLLVIWCADIIAARDAHRAPPLRLLPVMILWANLHGTFMFGLAFAGFMGVEAVWDPGPENKRTVEARRWAVFVVLAGIASLLTANGFDGFLEPFRIIGMATLQSTFTEWLSPNFQQFQPLEIWILGIIFVAFATRLTLPLPRLVLLLGLIHMSLQHIRHEDLLAVIAPLLLAAPLGSQIGEMIRSDPPSKLSRAFRTLARPPSHSAIMLAAGAAIAIAIFTLARPITRSDGPSTPATAFHAALDRGLSGPVLNNEGFGGYLVFNGVKSFIDGRIELFGDTFLKDYGEIIQGDEPKLTQALNRYSIAWTMLAPHDGAVTVMDHLPGWSRIYSDEYAVIHARAKP